MSDLPMPQNPRAHICVIGSLNFPGIGAEDIGLVKRSTRTALTTLVELDASFELWDSTEELENPSGAAQSTDS